MRPASFTPAWLHRRLATLLPHHPDANLCVALSGGIDSVVLLAALAAHSANRSRQYAALRAVHVHHGLHANADKWSKHCSALAARLQVPLTILRVRVSRPRGTSLEAAARDARYAALADAMEPGEVLLTAHHEDDQLETVFLQLMRGAGIAGLAAMPEVAPFARGTLARPLLTRSRAELEAWARANELEWVEDDSNENEHLDRNYLRRRVMPLIRERWPGAARAVSRSARHAAEAKRLLDVLALADVERAANGPNLSVQHLRALTPDRRRNAVRFWIARAGHLLPDTSRLDEITTTLLDARPDANPSVDWNGTHLQRHADYLSLHARDAAKGETPEAPKHPTRTKRETAAAPKHPALAKREAPAAPKRSTRPKGETTAAPSRPTRGDSPSATSMANEGTPWNWRASPASLAGNFLGKLSIQPDTHGPIDLDSLPDTLIIRRRIGGERFRPKRGGRTQTLKSLLQESRIPLADRARLPLLYNGDTLIAIGDRWFDESIQATASTRHRGRLRWHRD